MIEIGTERITAVVEELQGLVTDHWAEVNVFDRPLDINWPQYSRMSDSDQYHLTTIRLNSELVGWLGYFVYRHIRHQTVLMAREDWYYIRPDQRGQGLARQMFAQAESALRDRGVERVFVSCKTAHDHTDLLESLGHWHHEKNFTKALTLNEI